MHAEHTNRIGQVLLRHLPLAGGSAMLIGTGAPITVEWLKPHIGEARIAAVADLAVVDSLVTAENPAAEPYDVICFIDAFRDMDKSQQNEVLARARDLLIARVLHLEVTADSHPGDGGDQWKLADSLSLGYRRLAFGTFAKSAWALYEYNVFNYKNTPDWLNAKYWSNPRNWDRFRW